MDPSGSHWLLSFSFQRQAKAALIWRALKGQAVSRLLSTLDCTIYFKAAYMLKMHL